LVMIGRYVVCAACISSPPTPGNTGGKPGSATAARGTPGSATAVRGKVKCGGGGFVESGGFDSTGEGGTGGGGFVRVGGTSVCFARGC
jgi:hypothetical protein